MSAPTATRGPVGESLQKVAWNSSWLTEHRPFLLALGLATALRLVVMVAFTPALVHSDGPVYLSFLDTFEPSPERPSGYSLVLLTPLSWLTDSLSAVAAAQHLIGLSTAVLLYVLLRRWGVRRWPATFASLPVLFDSLQLILEHTVLSDTLFELMLVLGVAVLGWRRRPTPTAALVAGLLLGASAAVRLVAEPLVVVGVAYCLLAGDGWRGRLKAAAALAVGFALPIGAYATWYHQEQGRFALSDFQAKSMYMRSTTFVDCAHLSVPDYERVLCPAEPRGQRLDPTYYAYHDLRTLPRLAPPPGTTPDDAMRDFAFEAIREQPVAYVGTVIRDVALNFDVVRVDRFEYDTAHKWRFWSYLHPQATDWTGPAYAAHGGDQLAAHQPFAGALAIYGWVGYLPGPILLGCLVMGLLGGTRRRRFPGPELRPLSLLLTVTAAALLIVPALTAEFTWRYQLPALALLPAAAALGLTALRGGQVASGTSATASTD